eukprot:g67054.t1
MSTTRARTSTRWSYVLLKSMPPSAVEKMRVIRKKKCPAYIVIFSSHSLVEKWKTNFTLVLSCTIGSKPDPSRPSQTLALPTWRPSSSRRVSSSLAIWDGITTPPFATTST